MFEVPINSTYTNKGEEFFRNYVSSNSKDQRVSHVWLWLASFAKIASDCWFAEANEKQGTNFSSFAKPDYFSLGSFLVDAFRCIMTCRCIRTRGVRVIKVVSRLNRCCSVIIVSLCCVSAWWHYIHKTKTKYSKQPNRLPYKPIYHYNALLQNTKSHNGSQGRPSLYDFSPIQTKSKSHCGCMARDDVWKPLVDDWVSTCSTSYHYENTTIRDWWITKSGNGRSPHFGMGHPTLKSSKKWL